VIKLIGALLLIMALGIVGLVIARNYSLRPQQIRYMVHGIKMLETEMLYGLTPLPIALKRVGKKLPFPIGQFFLSTANFLIKGEGLTAGEAWEKALNNLRLESALLPEDLDVLLYFGQSLGGSDREEQSKNLKLVKEQLINQEKKAEELRAKNQKIWQYMGFSLGTVIALILL
jgi:stage III sporulation protein AB